MKQKFTDCINIVGQSCKNFDNTKWYVSTGAVDEDHINENDIESVDYETRPSRANLIVQDGDVLFAKMQGTKKSLLIDDEMKNHIYSTGFYAVRAKEKVITDKCLLHLLTSDTFLNQKDKNCSGATQKAITNTGLEKIMVNIPPYDEQDGITEQLDKAAKLIKLRNNEISALDDLIKSRFIELFGDPVSNPKKFDKRSLKDTCKVITGNTPSRAVEEYYGDFVEWIKTDNIVSGVINPTRAIEYLSEEGMKVGRIVEKDTILMACIAGSIASIGRVCVTDRTVAFNQQINAIVPKDYNPLFLYVLLQISKDYLIEDVSMALKGILSKSKLEEKEFIVPSIDLQQQFAAFVAQTDKSKFAVQKSLEKTQLLFDSLMQQYFG